MLPAMSEHPIQQVGYEKHEFCYEELDLHWLFLVDNTNVQSCIHAYVNKSKLTVLNNEKFLIHGLLRASAHKFYAFQFCE